MLSVRRPPVNLFYLQVVLTSDYKESFYCFIQSTLIDKDLLTFCGRFAADNAADFAMDV